MYDSEKPYTKEILRLIKRTHETPYVSVKDGLVIKKFDYPEMHHTDGVGTKGIYHWERRSFCDFVQDALAMNLNDLAMYRAHPYAIIDHLFIPKDDHEAIIEIVRCLSDECVKRNIAITGGETAIHDNIRGMDMSMTMLGFVNRPRPNQMLQGDVLIGLASSGLHSNGFTKVRELFGEKLRPEFTLPTRIYLDTILELYEKYDIHSMMHITGGAYTKLKPLLQDSDAIISRDHHLEPQDIFREMHEKGVSEKEMYKTFNCGIGFVLSASEHDALNILGHLSCHGDIKSAAIGRVVPGGGQVIIDSKFSDRTIRY